MYYPQWQWLTRWIQRGQSMRAMSKFHLYFYIYKGTTNGLMVCLRIMVRCNWAQQCLKLMFQHVRIRFLFYHGAFILTSATYAIDHSSTSHNAYISPNLQRLTILIPDTPLHSKVHGANMGPIWGRQDTGMPHVCLMNFSIWVDLQANNQPMKWYGCRLLWRRIEMSLFEWEYQNDIVKEI